ncbi:hypothetical protein [Stieleria varia]|uniref:hypothetical protein n=1 Tax=Stieleria varia TaxID=2528005 RepID=UPI0011B67890|nr:hypothetical protein [Stieleria varia]
MRCAFLDESSHVLIDGLLDTDALPLRDNLFEPQRVLPPYAFALCRPNKRTGVATPSSAA